MLRQSLRSWRSLFKDTLGSKIGLVFEKLLKFIIKLIFRTRECSQKTLESKILIINEVSRNKLNTIVKFDEKLEKNQVLRVIF